MIISMIFFSIKTLASAQSQLLLYYIKYAGNVIYAQTDLLNASTLFFFMIERLSFETLKSLFVC